MTINPKELVQTIFDKDEEIRFSRTIRACIGEKLDKNRDKLSMTDWEFKNFKAEVIDIIKECYHASRS